MGGFFGTVSKSSCVTDLFYGTDYNSHLGTKRGGLATYSQEKGFIRSIHNLESTYFRSKFEGELDKFKGNAGIGIISDTDAHPLSSIPTSAASPSSQLLKYRISRNWKKTFSTKICTSPNLVRAIPIKRNSSHCLSYKEEPSPKVSRTYSNISRVLVLC